MSARGSIVAVIALCASASIAAAKPLPDGLTFAIDHGHVMASQGGTSAALDSKDRSSRGALSSAALSDDGGTVVLSVAWCGDDQPGELRVPLVAVQARLDDARGLAAAKRRKYADAIAHFTTAISEDTSVPAYATDLLAAQLAAGKLADADRTLATLGASNRAWFAWRLLEDPALAKAASRPAARALAAAKPGHIKLGGQDRAGPGPTSMSAIGYSPLGLAAVGVQWISTCVMCSGPLDVVIVDLATGREVLRMPIVTVDESCDPDGGDPGPVAQDLACTKAQRARIKARRPRVERVLARLGFEATTTPAFAMSSDGSATVADADTTLTLANQVLTISTGANVTTVTLPLDAMAMTLVPHAIVYMGGGEGGDACDWIRPVVGAVAR